MHAGLVRAERVRDSPVVRAGAIEGYGALFNAGVVWKDGQFHLFVRAVRAGYRRNTGPGPRFLNYVSDVVVFESTDGVEYEFAYVLARSGDDTGVHCFEDPRVQIVSSGGEQHVVMTYTNLPAPESGHPWRIGAHRLGTRNARFHLEPETRRLLGPRDVANKDAVVFNLADGRVALIHRVHPDMQLALFDDLEHLWEANDQYWDEHMASLADHVLIRPAPDALGVGAGAPPVDTRAGLLLFFHERRGDGIYTTNVALLDSETGRVKTILGHALLEPELEWERYGDVDDVVFVQGAHRLDHDTVYLTYGAADRCVGAATVSIPRLLHALDQER